MCLLISERHVSSRNVGFFVNDLASIWTARTILINASLKFAGECLILQTERLQEEILLDVVASTP